MMIAGEPSQDVSRAALPAELAQMTERVVRRTRLWPSEKRDVRAELESHFVEGLADLLARGLSREQSIAALRDQFGDTDVAARLIRRGKKRGRPMLWKAVVSVAIAAAAALFGAGGYAAYLLHAEPSPSVDYLAQLNEPIEAVPPRDRAWPLLAEAICRFVPMPETLRNRSGGLPHPGDEDWAQAAEWLDANEAILPMLREAVDRPVFGFVYDKEQSIEFLIRLAHSRGDDGRLEQLLTLPQDNDALDPPLISMLLPGLSDLRAMAKLLIVDARRHHAGGRAEDRAAESGTVLSEDAGLALDTSFKLGRLLAEGSTLIEQLVGAAIIQLTCSETRELLQNASSDPGTRPWPLPALRSAEPDTLKGDFIGERLSLHDIVQYVFTDDGEGNGVLIPAQLARLSALCGQSAPGDPTHEPSQLAAAAIHADRASTTALFEELWDLMQRQIQLPLYHPRRNSLLQEYEALSAEPLHKHRYAVVHLVTPHLGLADQVIRECAMSLAATQTVVALFEYRADHGEFPGDLADLVPHYLQAVPNDAYSGHPLRYRAPAEEDSMALYSVGRNLEDNGGSSEKTPDPTRPGNLHPADLVYWGD